METVEITVPFVYDAKGKMPRQVNTRDLSFGEYVTFNLPVVDDAEAPVAVRYTKHAKTTGKNAEVYLDDDAPETIEYRVKDGEFYAVQSKYHAEGQATLETITHREQLSHNPIALASKSIGDYGSSRDYDAFIDGDLEEVAKYKLSWSDREERFAQLQQKLSEFLLIGDQLWVKCGQPMLHVKYHGTMTSSTADITVATVGEEIEDYSTSREGYYFRLDDYENAKDFADKGIKWTDRYAALTEHVHDLEILIPETITYLPDVGDFLGLAYYVLSHETDKVLKAGRGQANTWYDLQEAYDAFRQSKSEQALSAMIEAAERVIELTEELDRGHISYGRKLLKRFQERLEMRPTYDASKSILKI
jgi:hypothetical protein